MEGKMWVQIRIPAPWKKFAGDRDIIEAEGRTVKEVFHCLKDTYPGLKERLFDEQGKVRPLIIHVNNEDIRVIQDLETPLDEGDQVSFISIIPIIAGG
jgi:molybdopterin synthase sulfur carrier subunit